MDKSHKKLKLDTNEAQKVDSNESNASKNVQDDSGANEARQLSEIVDDESFVPLAAKDSEWMDVTYHKPKWRVKPTENEEEEEEQEMFLVNPSDESLNPDPENENLPIYALFPSLRVSYPESSSFLNHEVSTTDIAKSLVGEKPNFSVMKTSAKLLPSKMILESIQELPLDQESDDFISKDDDNSEVPDPYSIATTLSMNSKSTLEDEDEENLQKFQNLKAITVSFPVDNQAKGIWYEQSSDNEVGVPQADLLKKTIAQTDHSDTKMC